MRAFFIVSGGGAPRREIADRWVTGSRRVPGAALRLGGGASVSVPDGPALRSATAGGFTVECCVRTDGWSGRPVLLSNRDGSNDLNRGFSIDLIDEGKWRVNASDGERRTNVSGPVIADGRWHHLAVVFEAGGRLVLLQDGIRTAAADGPAAGSLSQSLGLSIGQDAVRSRPNFASVDVSEVRLWAAALPDSVLRNRMFRPVTGDHPFRGALAADWRMNDGSGTGVADSGPNGAGGTLTGTGASWIAVDDTVRTLDFDASEAAKTADLAAIALRHMGLPARPEWELDGRDWALPDTAAAVPRATGGSAETAGLEVRPNPFRGTASVDLVLPGTDPASLCLYDVLGRRVRTVWTGSGGAAVRRLSLDCRGLPSGVYVLVLRTGRAVRSRKLVAVE
jgi:hypothetical protein